MRCKNCGYNLDGRQLICPVCGQEVPFGEQDSYSESSSGSRGSSRKYSSGKSRKRNSFRKAPQELTTPEDIYKESRRSRIHKKKKRNYKRILILLVMLCLIGGAGYGVYQGMDYMINRNNFEYQYKHAKSSYKHGHYKRAYDYIQQALTLEDTSEKAWLLKSKIFIEQGYTDNAISSLQKLIGLYPDDEDAYELLSGIYDDEDDLEHLKALFENCDNEQILSDFSEFVCNPPESNLDSGEYSNYQTLTLSADTGSVIYYTLDGTTPDENSAVYSEPIELDTEALTVVQAFAVNARGITSDIAKYRITVALPVPGTPSISPKSGEYASGTTIEIDVPDGYTCYYEWDDKPNVDNAYVYNGPVTMLSGQHVFYAMYVNEYGKVSYAASATYAVGVAMSDDE